MPRTLPPLPDPVDTTIGLTLNLSRFGPGAAGVRLELTVPGDPGGEYVTLGTDYTAGERTQLKAVQDMVIAKFKAARGYV